MSDQSSEPDPNRCPLRESMDDFLLIAGSLAEIRRGMDIVDPALVTDFYERWQYVNGAALFKSNLQEVEAPEQQARNISNAVALAEQIAPDDEGFHQYIRDIWGFMVPRSVASQAEAFKKTRPLVHKNPFILDKVPRLDATENLENPTLIIGRKEIVVLGGGKILSVALPNQPEYLDSLPEGVWNSQPESLAAVPAHLDAGEGLRRYSFTDSPLHSALHVIDDATNTTESYCTVHSHDDTAELNVIIPAESGLTYEISNGMSEELIEEPTALFFPPGMPHCAIAKEGSGLFYVARIPIDAHKYYDSVAPGSRMIDPDLVDPESPMPAFEQQYGMPFFEYLRQNPTEWALFNLKMEYGLRDMLPPDSIARLQLPEHGTIADVGGGLGYILGQAKTANTDLNTVLYEQPFVCDQAKRTNNGIDIFESGDMFNDFLPAADIYVLARVLHDWPDEENVKLLENIRRSAPANAQLRIIDTFLDEDRQGPARALQQQRSMDLIGRSRQHTVQELQALLAASGWHAHDQAQPLNESISYLGAYLM